MSFKVNTRPRTPHPMGSIATCQVPLAMSYMETSLELWSIEEKGASRIPSYPIEPRTLTCAWNIQLLHSRRRSQSHELMSSAIDA